jgi:hypothetical protein
MKAAFRHVYPFSHSRLYGAEKYDLQNMLLKEVNFPAFYYPEQDKLYDAWSDRVYFEWDEANKVVVSSAYGDERYAHATDESLLKFGNQLFSNINREKIELTGVAIVRHTDVSSGYPVLYAMGIKEIKPGARVRGIPKIYPFVPEEPEGLRFGLY